MSTIRADSLKDRLGVGAPSAPLGMNVTGVCTATTFSGSGASLTNLDASDLASGTIPDARFPATLPAISGANLTNIPGGGKLLQVVQQYDASFTRNANASSTYADTAHYVEITPTAASSKILVNISGACNNNGAGNTIYMDIYSSINGSSFASISPNGSSVPTAGFTLNKGDSSRNEIPMNIQYLDTPSYTVGDAITYKLYIRNNGSGSVEVPSNPGGEPVICIAQEIAA